MGADHLYQRFTERIKVGATLCGILTVDERVNLFAVMITMREGNFHVFTAQVDNGIAGGFCPCFLFQQVQKAVFGKKIFAVKIYF